MLLLRLGASGSFCVALLHIVIVLMGAPAYRFFGAGKEMALAAEKGKWQPATITLTLAVVFALWGLYALSAAGDFRQLLFVRGITLAIGAVYTLRGVLVFAQLWLYRDTLGSVSTLSNLFFSLVSLTIGLLYLFGLVQRWQHLV